MKKLVLFSALLFSFALVVGCGGPKRPPGLPKLYECVLTFQMEDGSPVNNASVSLSPENAAMAEWSISGTTDSSGTARIYAYADFPGAPAGKYKVLIRKFEKIVTDDRDRDGMPIINALSLLSEKYNSASKTPFSLEVPEKAVKETFTVEK